MKITYKSLSLCVTPVKINLSFTFISVFVFRQIILITNISVLVSHRILRFRWVIVGFEVVLIVICTQCQRGWCFLRSSGFLSLKFVVPFFQLLFVGGYKSSSFFILYYTVFSCGFLLTALLCRSGDCFSCGSLIFSAIL